jgi:hypothetical protein
MASTKFDKADYYYDYDEFAAMVRRQDSLKANP